MLVVSTAGILAPAFRNRCAIFQRLTGDPGSAALCFNSGSYQRAKSILPPCRTSRATVVNNRVGSDEREGTSGSNDAMGPMKATWKKKHFRHFPPSRSTKTILAFLLPAFQSLLLLQIFFRYFPTRTLNWKTI